MTAEYLRNAMSYDAKTGVFVWKNPPVNHPRLRGLRAGSFSNGYVLIRVCGHKYGAHRLAWLHAYGDWPAMRVDHIDGDTKNNRISNLRLATSAQNNANARPWRGKLLPKGVRKTAAGRFEARISFDKRTVQLGTHTTSDEAFAAYCAAAVRFYGEFARTQ
jgi:HNH endonuclease/AP2 domain